ncbi:hypothetical protein [Priestia filamentosa]|uniref:hypothetical protein n=1 Tax=Priestia filamentosa TaxID=1402861 RepID=UPI000A0862A1|nr:hypothetical protein [Priestia filamentosa]MDT3762955.1 hypothetical protein [Priestia filamentosa]OXS69477.1 hypothetical protein B1B01_10945 [Priestia filamentosa]WRU97396.1 hypothetical protein RYX51_10100 [Priestia filamentosa]SMF33074.1 hypothetical protein SAMN06296056_102761 [Priestia filamentosa]
MPFTAPLPIWNNPGQKPPDSTIERGWGAGEYPPADWFNWQWYTTYKAIEEIQNLAATTTELANHTNRKDNPHQVTSQQVTAVAAIDGTVSGDSYPTGLTVFDATNLTGYPTLFGTVVTSKINNSRMSQWFFEHAFNDTQVGVYLRHWHTTPARWTSWVRIETTEGAEAKVNTHANKKDNPHSVTAEQVGAYSKAESDNKYETPTGAQTKANQAETKAKSYVDGKVKGEKIQFGKVTVTIPGNSIKTTTVTFPEGFSAFPVVTASINNSVSPDKYPAPTIGVVTTTSFQITGQNTSSGAIVFDYGWIAMG